MTQGTQNTIVETNLPSFPWLVGDKLDAVPLNNAFISLQEQISNLFGIIALLQHQSGGGTSTGTSVTLNWGGGATITPGLYVISAYAAYGFEITSLVTNVGINGGSFEATVLVNNVPVGSLTNLTVNGGKTTTQATPPDTVGMGDEIDILISNVVGAPIDAYVCLTSSPPLSVPNYQIAVGIANGFGAAVATSAYQFLVQGTAIGTSNAQATGTSVSASQAIGTATGTSQAKAVGTSVSGNPTLVLDDAIIGRLDINPLG